MLGSCRLPFLREAVFWKHCDCNARVGQILLLSLESGGVGLNLTSASHMIMMDVHWNAALEQRIYDRIHRIGQVRDVFNHRLIVKRTIEERIIEWQKKKLHM